MCIVYYCKYDSAQDSIYDVNKTDILKTDSDFYEEMLYGCVCVSVVVCLSLSLCLVRVRAHACVCVCGGGGAKKTD